MFSKGKKSVINLDNILSKISEAEIASFYFDIVSIPTKIKSPLRFEKHPSFGIFSPDGIKVCFKDFATGQSGGIIHLLELVYNKSFEEVIQMIYTDFNLMHKNISVRKTSEKFKILNKKVPTILSCKIRKWKKYDIEYWKSYGISYKWLEYAEIYPISHKIIYKDNKQYTFGADKYAYVYIERKEGNISLKIYQPFNKEGFKWCTNNDSSVISLWTKIPENGQILCICSSVKDALCLTCNTKIPAIAIQSETTRLSKTAVKELKRRFNNIYIFLDNDVAGIENSHILTTETGFKELILPKIGNAKDISDLYKSLGDKKKFKEIIFKLFEKNGKT